MSSVKRSRVDPTVIATMPSGTSTHGLRSSWPVLIFPMDTEAGNALMQLPNSNLATIPVPICFRINNHLRMMMWMILIIRQEPVWSGFHRSCPTWWSWFRLWHSFSLCWSQRRSLPFPRRWFFSLGIQEDQGRQIPVTYFISHLPPVTDVIELQPENLKRIISTTFNYIWNISLFFSVGRQILTKRAGADDDIADADAEDITSLYKNSDNVSRQKQGDGGFTSPFCNQLLLLSSLLKRSLFKNQRKLLRPTFSAFDFSLFTKSIPTLKLF